MRIIIIALAVCLSGCASTQPLQVTAPCPKVVIPIEPHYPIQDLKPGSSPPTVAKAYVATVQMQHDYIEELRHILRGYT
jgi:hypothetical protein